ncbi:putative transcription factor interactor and regulator LIM family [Dioscorea sansibarensis]
MAFCGTQDKCKACDKTVHFIDLLTADGVPYHKTCFKCSHCKGNLTMCNYSSMDGVLYCKPHFEQLFKETGNFSKNFQSGKSGDKNNELVCFKDTKQTVVDVQRDTGQMRCLQQNRLSVGEGMFIFFLFIELFIFWQLIVSIIQLTMEGESYHKTCFKCAHGGCKLTTSNYAALDGVLYCKHHFAQLFKEKGSYNHLNKTASMKKNAESASEPEPETEPEPRTKTTEEQSTQNES